MRKVVFLRGETKECIQQQKISLLADLAGNEVNPRNISYQDSAMHRSGARLLMFKMRGHGEFSLVCLKKVGGIKLTTGA
jgi:hypothetical protein